jgi:uncharacterized membrane protein
MTVTENVLEIAAPAQAIYRLAAATERWPEILPHYRFVRILDERGTVRTVEMGAWRHVFPIRWVAEQVNDPERPHIRFRHVRGWTCGMDVEWLFAPLAGDRTRVTIVHRLQFRFPVAADWLGRHLVADYFIDGVATQTLAWMKRLAERAA